MSCMGGRLSWGTGCILFQLSFGRSVEWLAKSLVIASYGDGGESWRIGYWSMKL